MTTEPCDVCGEAVKIGESAVNLWDFGGGSTGGMTLELADGSEHFLCHDCIDDLPKDSTVTAADVEALRES